MTNEKEIVVTPALDHLFHTMIEEARNQGKAKDMFDALPADLEPVGLRIIQRFLAPLNIAAQCFTKRGEIEQFREVLSQIVQDIDKTAAQLEADLAEVDLEMMETPR
jgi:hypothetical protein